MPEADDMTRQRKRKKLPRAVIETVHLESGYQCARPQCRMMLVLDAHHIEWVTDGGGNEASNLIVLCPNCHTMYHRGQITDEAIWHWKALSVAMNNAFDRRSIDELLTIHQLKSICFSGGEILKIASLLQAKLVEVKELMASSAGTAIVSQYEVVTTLRGRLLVDAWRTGQSEKFSMLMNESPEDVQPSEGTRP